MVEHRRSQQLLIRLAVAGAKRIRAQAPITQQSQSFLCVQLYTDHRFVAVQSSYCLLKFTETTFQPVGEIGQSLGLVQRLAAYRGARTRRTTNSVSI